MFHNGGTTQLGKANQFFTHFVSFILGLTYIFYFGIGFDIAQSIERTPVEVTPLWLPRRLAGAGCLPAGRRLRR